MQPSFSARRAHHCDSLLNPAIRRPAEAFKIDGWVWPLDPVIVGFEARIPREDELGNRQPEPSR
jgi:hypothetical protein